MAAQMQSNLLEHTVGDVLRQSLSETAGDHFVVNPSAETTEALIDEMSEVRGSVRLLAAEETLKEVMDDFIVASEAADFVEAGRLEMRVFDETGSALVVTEESVVSVVSAGEMFAGLATDDEEFATRAYERYTDVWEESQPFKLRTPGITRVRETLHGEIAPATADDFDAVLASLETARGNGDGLDEVTISLLVAARNEELLYDISKWGEDVGMASKATFSRTKTRLEDIGLLDTEKVPIDVGRPRLRLMLGDERLRDADTDELANVAQSLLASRAS